MTDDVDPTVSEALRRLASSAPQPREDRLQAVVAGAHRHQLRVVAASALGVVALIAATGFGVQTWRDSAARTPTPVGPVGNPAVSPSGSPAPQPTGSLDGLALQSPAPVSSPATQSSPRPSTSGHPTPKATAAPKMAADGQVNPKISIELSAAHAVSGQQLRVTVIVRNESRVIYPKADVSLGTDPSDTFTQVPKGCTLPDGGADCPVAELQPDHHVTLVFTLSLGGGVGPGVSSHEIFGTYNYTDSHGKSQQAPQFSAQVMVDNTASSSPPASVPPGSPLTSPPSSGPPSSTMPISSSS